MARSATGWETKGRASGIPNEACPIGSPNGLNIPSGDVVVTAGLGLGEEFRSLYPKGLVVGKVLQLQQAEAAAYQRAIIAPAVDVRRLEHVLVVKTTP